MCVRVCVHAYVRVCVCVRAGVRASRVGSGIESKSSDLYHTHFCLQRRHSRANVEGQERVQQLRALLHLGLERRLNGQEYTLLFQRIRVRFPGYTQWLRIETPVPGDLLASDGTRHACGAQAHTQSEHPHAQNKRIKQMKMPTRVKQFNKLEEQEKTK